MLERIGDCVDCRGERVEEAAVGGVGVAGGSGERAEVMRSSAADRCKASLRRTSMQAGRAGARERGTRGAMRERIPKAAVRRGAEAAGSKGVRGEGEAVGVEDDEVVEVERDGAIQDASTATSCVLRANSSAAREVVHSCDRAWSAGAAVDGWDGEMC